jgi:hypothetical protein
MNTSDWHLILAFDTNVVFLYYNDWKQNYQLLKLIRMIHTWVIENQSEPENIFKPCIRFYLVELIH